MANYELAIALGSLAISLATIIISWIAFKQKVDHEYVDGIENRLHRCEEEMRKCHEERQRLRDENIDLMRRLIKYGDTNGHK